MRSEMALIVDLATNIALDDLSHIQNVLSALQRAKPKAHSRSRFRFGLIVIDGHQGQLILNPVHRL
jgi:hypothetical protein